MSYYVKRKWNKIDLLNYGAREERYQKLLTELSFKEHKEEISAIIELNRRANKIDSKIFKQKDSFSTTVLKATMKFKHILRRVRLRLANKAKGISDDPSFVNKDEERKVKLSLSSSESSGSEESSNSSDSKSDNWRRRRSDNNSEIIIKPPTLREKSQNQTKIRLFNEDKELSVIEEKSYINSKYSKNDIESFASSYALAKLSKDHDYTSKSNRKDITPASKSKNSWNADVQSNASFVNKQNTLETIQKHLNNSSEDTKSFEKDKIDANNENSLPMNTSKMEKIDELLNNANELISKDQVFKPNMTFNIPKSKTRNHYEKNILVTGTNKEIMGNSWINSAETQNITELKKERSKLNLADIEREIADLETPLSIIEERPKDYTTNVDSRENFKNDLSGSKPQDKKVEDDSITHSIASRFGEPSFMGNLSSSSLRKIQKSEKYSLSISEMSQIQRDYNNIS